MDSGQKRALLKKLIEEKERLAAQIDFFNRQGLDSEMGESIGELSAYDNHPADIGSEVFERSKDTALRENARLAKEQIERALEKLALGTYGVCDWCGCEIERTRLVAHPQATTCFSCQQLTKKGVSKKDRPVEEEVLGVPFAGKSWDGAGRLAYSGEDAWEDVASYNKTGDQVPGTGPGSDGESAAGDGGTGVDGEDVDSVPYELGKDGIFYWDPVGQEGGEPPRGR